MSDIGKSIELFFINGTPDGMVTATIPFQWTGHVLVAQRTQLQEALKREETNRPGIYILISEYNDKPQIYVGETDEIKSRIATHAREKDWWESLIVITSNGEPINKAHARYLEYQIFNRAKITKKANLDFGRSPTESTLNEAAKAHMDDFLKNIYLVLPALRFDFLTLQESSNTRTQSFEDAQNDKVLFELKVPKHGIEANAELLNGKFTVLAGSIARAKWSGSTTAHSTYSKLFNDLVEQEILEQNGSHRIFVKNYTFKSPSAAAAVTAGRPTSGPEHWKLKGTNKSYKEWEKERLQQL